MTSTRRFPPPWKVEQMPGGFKVLDASGQALAYVYAHGPAASFFKPSVANRRVVALR